jgi:predicted lipoprotein with Yx(FWY)xxD motif
MRTPVPALLLGFVCWLFAVPPALAAPAATALAVPGDFSIADEGPGKLTIRTSPQNLPIYVFDEDAPGKSNCNAGCIGAWTPVVVTGTSKSLGDWTVIERDDHRKQWAYKGRPLYTYFNDAPGKPTGDGEEGKWHLFQP